MFFSRRYAPPSGDGEGEKILFIRYSALGDILLATPYARALKERYPESELTWLVARPYEEILEGQPFINKILPWDRHKDNKAFVQLLLEIRKQRFTRVVSLHGSDRGAIMALFSGASNRYCDPAKWKFIYSKADDTFWNVHGLTEPKTSDVGFVATREMLEWASENLNQAGESFILAAIGASREVKQWPAIRWIEFAEYASGRGIVTVLAGDGPEEEAKAHEIERATASTKLVNMVGKVPLSFLAGVVAKARLVIAGDTGILNMARIMGVPSLALLGPTGLPAGPGLMEPGQIFYADCPEINCGRHRCPQDCLGSIRADEVFSAVLSYW